jgi:hypothetical protein
MFARFPVVPHVKRNVDQSLRTVLARSPCARPPCEQLQYYSVAKVCSSLRQILGPLPGRRKLGRMSCFRTLQQTARTSLLSFWPESSPTDVMCCCFAPSYWLPTSIVINNRYITAAIGKNRPRATFPIGNYTYTKTSH